jgi:hypothetical protein
MQPADDREIMIAAQTRRVCRERKPASTLPDRALRRLAPPLDPPHRAQQFGDELFDGRLPGGLEDALVPLVLVESDLTVQVMTLWHPASSRRIDMTRIIRATCA